MKPQAFFVSPTLHRMTLFCSALVFLPIWPVLGQTIPNPSFEADTFTVAPGSISANTPITGWSAADNTKAGLNPAGGLNPYANNGTVPNGTNVAFLQPTNALTTTISGLEVGSNYLLRFRVNAQTAQRPALRLGLDGAPIFEAGGVAPVGGANRYQYVAVPFTATATAHTLAISNNTTLAGLTNVLLVDDFSVTLNTSGWSFEAWTNDASSGVDSSKNYTHAYAFNVSGVPFTINGVPFTRVAGAGPQVPYELQTSGLGSATTDAGNVIRTAAGGSSSNLAFGFVYNGNPEIITLENLVPGLEYVATIFSVGWEARTSGRSAIWGVGNDRMSINENHFGDGVGIRISYRYTAPASGYLSISNFPYSTAAGTFHIFGLANYEVNPQSAPVIGVQPVSKASIPGGGAGFYITAGGARPLNFRWMKDGVEIANQTNRTLILSNLTSGDLAGYSVSVSNASGVVVTSTVATLTFDTATIPNPSFEADTFLTSPGYSSVNFPISGWISSNPAKTGLNPAADVLGPFANNGTVPDGSRVAFLQSTCALSTTISGLVSNQVYTLQFRANGRATQRPNLVIGINGQTLLDTLHYPVTGTNAYRFVSLDFTAPDTNALLTLTCATNYYAGDHSVLVDNFTIAPSTSKWSFAIWTNDATSEVDPTKLHTHAFHFGSTVPDTTINGVTFRGVAGANPSVPGFFSSSGLGSVYTGPDFNIFNVTLGGSAGMSSQFVFGGTVQSIQSITLNNLLPGTEYIASIFSVAFDAKGYGRSATFSVGSDRMTINQDHFGLDNGIVVSYRYVADASGTLTLTYVPTDGSPSSFHTYAFANRVARDSAPVIGAQPQNTFVSLGSVATLSVGLSAGSLPISYQWQFDGADILDQTNSTLVLSNLNALGSTSYRVIITNSLGSVTSVVATLEVGVNLAEVFNTGVDISGTMMGGGLTDPHYQIIVSPDTNYPGPAAMTLANGVYPVTPGTYITNGSGAVSAWITSSTNGAALAVGTYVYRTAFIIDSTDPGRAQISGLWASDNDGMDIVLNGVSLGISNRSTRPFGSLFPFTITNGFVAGSNTLDFVISNQPPAGWTGLRAELAGVGRPLTAARPQIVNQPTSRLVPELSDVTFAVLARGSGPLSYQWFFEGIDLPNETNRTLRLTHVSQFDQQGSYWVVVTNPEGQTNSAIAVLTVMVPPFLSAQPVDQIVECGSAASFDAFAEGEEPLAYQWYFGTAPIPGATDLQLTLPNVGPTNAGAYTLVVTNLVGSATSTVARLTVLDTTRPTITQCASNRTLPADNNDQAILPNLTGLVVATDCNPLTITQSPPAGTVLGLGATNILITVTDLSNNVATCSATVTVEPFVSTVNLAIERQAATALLSWPVAAGSAWKLWQTDNLTPARSWSEVTNSVVTEGGLYKVTVDAVTNKMFFRLQRP